MSKKSQSKQFRYGEDESNDYINGLVSGAPRRSTPYEPMDTSTNFVPRDGWTSDIYTHSNGGQRRTPKHGCFSCTVLIYSLILALVGIAIILLGWMETKRKFLPVCPDCSHIVMAFYIVGTVITVIGILGIAAAVVRLKAVAIPYSIVILLIGLGFVAVGVTAVLIQGNLENINLLPLWKSSVETSSDFICDAQSKLKCSGFKDGCCATNSTPVDVTFPWLNNSYCYLTVGAINGSHYFLSLPALQPVTWPSEVCVLGCVNNNFTTMCDVAIRNEIKENLIPITASVFPFGIISVVVGVMSICMTRKTDGLAR